MGSRRGWVLGVVALVAALSSACAAKATAPPALPATLKYAEFTYPTIPTDLTASPAAPLVDRGWRYLQNDDLSGADREFGQALKLVRTFYPAQAGIGYVELARREYQKAVSAFDSALNANRSYVPALIGRGQSLLGLKRDADALGAFERALAVDPSLADVRRRVEVLQFRNLQNLIAAARRSATAGKLDDARSAYDRAIAVSPESAFLYRELGVVEHRQGDSDHALEHLRKAIELDGMDAAALVELGSILDEHQDFDGALTSYRKAAEIEPSADLAARITATAARAREARLPPELKAIPQSAQITRGELAALLGVRLEPLLRPAATKQIVATDVRSSWAAPWIALVINAGVMSTYDNHTFQPQGKVRRADLATAVSQVLQLVARGRPDLRAKMAERPRIADMSTAHLDYPAAAVAVSTGVLPLSDGRFQVSRQVSGAEAIDAITRLQALADIH